MVVTIGQIVHFVAFPGACVPAIVVAVPDADAQLCHLTIFHTAESMLAMGEGTLVVHEEDVPYDADGTAPCTWHQRESWRVCATPGGSDGEEGPTH